MKEIDAYDFRKGKTFKNLIKKKEWIKKHSNLIIDENFIVENWYYLERKNKKIIIL